MHIFPTRARYLPLLAVPLLVTAVASGCNKKELVAAYACKDEPIKVNHENANHKGVDRKAVYLCSSDPHLGKSYQIIWTSDSTKIKSFTIDFVGPDYPFGPNVHFASNSAGTVTSPTLTDPDDVTDVTVYKYNLIVTDEHDVKYKFDPHVVGGGGIAILIKDLSRRSNQ